MNKKTLIMVTVVVALLALTLSFEAMAQGPKSDNFTKIVGYYGQMSAKYWSWLMAIPEDVNPANAQGYFDASVGQKGNVWFLASSFGSGYGVDRDPFVRSCEVPKDKFLFFPVMNYFSWGPEDGTIREMKEFNKWLIDLVDLDTLKCFVDGEEVNIVRTGSPVFGFENGIGRDLDYDGDVDEDDWGRRTCVSDGFWVLVPPLSPGYVHEISFNATLTYEDWGIDWFQDITYYITVEE